MPKKRSMFEAVVAPPLVELEAIDAFSLYRVEDHTLLVKDRVTTLQLEFNSRAVILEEAQVVTLWTALDDWLGKRHG